MNLQDLKRLRELTDAPLPLCKEALEHSQGDMDLALDWVRGKQKERQAEVSDELVDEEALMAEVHRSIENSGLDQGQKSHLSSYIASEGENEARLVGETASVKLVQNKKYLSKKVTDRSPSSLEATQNPTEEANKFPTVAQAKMALIVQATAYFRAGFLDWKDHSRREIEREREDLKGDLLRLNIAPGDFDREALEYRARGDRFDLKVLGLGAKKRTARLLGNLDYSKVAKLEWNLGQGDDPSESLEAYQELLSDLKVDGLQELELGSYAFAEALLGQDALLDVRKFGRAIQKVPQVTLRAPRVHLTGLQSPTIRVMSVEAVHFENPDLGDFFDHNWADLTTLGFFKCDVEGSRTFEVEYFFRQLSQLKAPQLHTLKIDNLDFAPGAICSLLRKCPFVSRLKRVSLRSNRLRDQDIPDLEELARLPLQLDLANNEISEDGIRGLQERFPQVSGQQRSGLDSRTRLIHLADSDPLIEFNYL